MTPKNVTHEALVTHLSVFVDKACSGGVTSKEPGVRLDNDLPPGSLLQGGDVDLPSEGLTTHAFDMSGKHWGADPWGSKNGYPLNLAVFVDASVLEVFAMGGHGRVTSRIYPFESGTDWGLSIFATGFDMLSNIEVFNMTSCWV